MKKIALFIALLSAINFYGQQKVAAHLQQLEKAKTVFKKFSPFTAQNSPGTPTLQKTVSNATYAQLNSTLCNDIAANKYNAIELDIPYNNTLITVQLYRADITAQGFHIDTNRSRDIAYSNGAQYRGIIKGDAASLVSFNFFNNEANGIISGAAFNNVVVGRLTTTDDFFSYIIYSDANLNAVNNFKCGVTDFKTLPEGHDHGRDAQDDLSNRCVTVYFEMDYELFVQNGADTTLASNWITSVFNNVQTLYDNDGITLALKSLFIWTEPDPYFGSSSSDYLEQFYNNRPVFDGDVGQLLGIDEGGLGGLAIDIAGLCSEYNISYSDVDLQYQDVPVFSWTVQVISHELGHLLGSPHTHGCYWNGNNTAIDGCGSSEGYVEGSCVEGPIPFFTQGTIMSYCHLVDGVGINLANGFGPQPAARMLNHVESSFCLSTDCINTCINTITAVEASVSTTTSVTVTWTDEIGGPWEVSYSAINGFIGNWELTTVNSYTINNLSPNTYYTVNIRPVCTEVQTPQTQQFVVATAADWCSGAIFADTGGGFDNYPDEQQMVRTIRPASTFQDIIVTFNSFNTEADYDYLYVYDGPTTTAPLIGVYSGSILPGPFISSSPDGSLTFKFLSDQNLNEQGWDATVSCSALDVEEHSFTGLQYYPNPAQNSVTITSPDGITNIKVYNMAGQLLLQKVTDANTVEADISAFANGVYLFDVSNGSRQAHFRIVKQ